MVTSNRQRRLQAEQTNLIDRSSPVVFEYNGRQMHAFQGDTIASALYAAGVRIFTRSFKYHRPRGLLCVAGHCPNCMMTVDEVPNVRVCTEPAREGMHVRSQNAWPSPEHDAMSVLDRFDRLLPVGFYYKTFHTPKLFWKMARPIIRSAAGLGSVPDKPSSTRNHHEFRHTDVAVVGGGPAGMSAALAAAEAGARVTLVDDQLSLGGRLRYDSRTYDDLPDMTALTGLEAAERLAQSIRSSGRIDTLSGATAFGLYEGNLIGIVQGTTTIKLRAQRVVVATGSYEVPLTFDRNDLPGVMLSTGLQRLIHLYGIKPGSTAIVGATNDQGYHAALDLLRAGVRIAVLADTRPHIPEGLDAARALRQDGVLVLPSHSLVRAQGVKRVDGGVVARLENGTTTGEERQFDADIVAMAGGFQPAGSLLHQIGSGSVYDAALDENTPANLPASIYAAGDVTGVHSTRVGVLQGRVAGLEAAAGLDGGTRGADLADLGKRLDEAEAEYGRAASVARAPLEMELGAKQFVCYCEDVTTRDIAAGIDEGFDDVQTLKRYSTVTMGPCQGKMCQKTFLDICALQTGRGIDDLGTTTARPPVRPVTLGALAGPSHFPIKRTSLDRKHRELGATMIDSNVWRRPQLYTSAQEEATNVRSRVGMIDVSTLGKLDVQGRDAPSLLDRLYTHHFSTLGVGRVRYGVLCADNGTIMDDGTVTRLADDHYFVTTSTASAEAVEEWFKWWMAGSDMCAHVTDVTSGYAAINVAGPSARETLVKLTDVDLSPRGFRYMRAKQGEAAGVPTLFLRIGFVGETGWELHFPAEYGEHMWDALMDAGEEFGIAPFGTETQRILRLEKKHIIPNQDTDMVSSPLDSDMEWVVKFEKEDFIGRGGLIAARDRPPRMKLVGFVMRNGVVPHDGDAVVSGSAPIGRVTSSRLSPTSGKGFGLCWVPAELAQDGSLIHIRTDGQTSPAEVRLDPLYDPEGERLRQ